MLYQKTQVILRRKQIVLNLLRIVHVWFPFFSDKYCLVEIWEVNDTREHIQEFAFQTSAHVLFQTLDYDKGGGKGERKAQRHEKECVRV